MLRRLLVLGLFIAMPVIARADGVTDFVIDPATGYHITKPGSYRLAADVTLDGAAYGILVESDRVSIDLNGHTIDGAGAAQVGVVTAGWECQIRNGTLRGFLGDGVNIVGGDSHLSDLKITDCLSGCELIGRLQIVERCTIRDIGSVENLVVGIQIGADSVVRDCTLKSFSATGSSPGLYMIKAEDNCTITGNIVEGGSAAGEFSAVGIETGLGCIIRGNISKGTTGGKAVGIHSLGNALIEGNVCEGNTGTQAEGYGISAGAGGTIRGNTCKGNGGVTSAGIQSDGDSVIDDNLCEGNTAAASTQSFGIKAGAGGLIRGNTCKANIGVASTGISSAGKVLLKDNVCEGNTGTGLAGNGYGINAGSDSRVIGNLCIDNDGTGTGSAQGIAISGNSRVEDNHCTNHSGGLVGSFGILVSGSNNTIRENSTANNTLAGIRLLGSGNRCEVNRLSEATGVLDAGGNSIGAGDLANTAF